MISFNKFNPTPPPPPMFMDAITPLATAHVTSIIEAQVFFWRGEKRGRKKRDVLIAKWLLLFGPSARKTPGKVCLREGGNAGN